MITSDIKPKIEFIDSFLELMQNSSISSLADELADYENKIFEIVLSKENKNFAEIDSILNPLANEANLFKNYYRNLVKVNASIENLLQSDKNSVIENSEIFKTVELLRQIEEFIFQIQDNSDSGKNFQKFRNLLQQYSFREKELLLLRKTYLEAILKTGLPENYTDFEISFFTDSDYLEDFNVRIVFFKVLYEIILKIINPTEEGKLLILKAEKEKNEYFHLAGSKEIIKVMYSFINEFNQQIQINHNSSELNSFKDLEKRIKNLIEQKLLDQFTGERYLEVLKKALESLKSGDLSKIKLLSSFIAKSGQFEPIQNIEFIKAEELLKNAVSLISLKRYKDALNCIDQSLSLQPNYAEAYNLKGRILMQNGQEIEALEFLDRAIELKPDYKESYLDKGSVFFSLKSYRDAAEQYQKAIELDPLYAEGYFNLGSCYMMLGEMVDAATEAFSKAIKLQPDYAAAYYNRSCAYISAKNTNACLEDLEKTIKIDSRFKSSIKFDPYFEGIKEKPEFKKLFS